MRIENQIRVLPVWAAGQSCFGDLRERELADGVEDQRGGDGPHRRIPIPTEYSSSIRFFQATFQKICSEFSSGFLRLR